MESSPLDDAFVATVRAAARREADALVADTSDLALLPHRELMRRAKTLLSVTVDAGPLDPGRADRVAAATRLVAQLRSLQSPSGLFAGGDNVQSPPDSAFTINDVADAIAFTGGADLEPVRDELLAIARSAAAALRAGGVHTPNHRWELAAGLARLHRVLPDAALVARVEEWLAEGVDIDADGLYSERSPNYAAHVTNPSLRVIGSILGKPALHDAVERNLDATLRLLRLDGTVETLPSRRQDQGRPFPLAPYLVPLRATALASGRGDLADAARTAAAQAVDDPGVLAELLLDPGLAAPLPSSAAPASSTATLLSGVALASRRDGAVESVVYAGSDYPRQGRIRSGLANDPTFLRLFAGGAVLDAARLSRSFFDLGPFRAAGLEPLRPSAYRLREELTAAYYQPLPAAARRADGVYQLGDEGRFSAAMAFDRRPADEVRMTTVIDVELRPDGVDLAITIDAPPLPWSLELAFREGGSWDGDVLDLADGLRALVPAPATAPGSVPVSASIPAAARYRVGDDAISVEAEGAELSATPLRYHPGQDYRFLGATDAVGGNRLLIGASAPARLVLRLRAETAR